MALMAEAPPNTPTYEATADAKVQARVGRFICLA